MKYILFASILISSFMSFAEDKKEVLKVYGSEGPYPAVRGAADAFSAANNVKVTIVDGPPAKWRSDSLKDADVIYSSSENVMDFLNDNLGTIDDKTITPLFLRPAALVVRKGNPKKIKGIKDILRRDLKVIIVYGQGQGQEALWEDIVGRLKDIQYITDFRKRIVFSARSAGEALKYWTNHHEVDAWLTFNIWAKRDDVPDAELVNIEKDLVVYRSMGAAVTTITNQRELALKFIDYLKTPEAEKIFKTHGWFKKEK